MLNDVVWLCHSKILSCFKPFRIFLFQINRARVIKSRRKVFQCSLSIGMVFRTRSLAFVSAVLSRYRFPPALYSYKWDPETDVTALAERKIDWILRNYLSSFSRRLSSVCQKGDETFHFYFFASHSENAVPNGQITGTMISTSQFYEQC